MVEKVNLGARGGFGLHKGALHRALHVAGDRRIPAKKLAEAADSRNPHVRRMAASAKGLEAMSHRHFGGSPLQ